MYWKVHGGKDIVSLVCLCTSAVQGAWHRMGPLEYSMREDSLTAHCRIPSGPNVAWYIIGLLGYKL